MHCISLSSVMEDDRPDAVECQMKVFHFDNDVDDEILMTFTNTLANDLSMGSRSSSSSSRFVGTPLLSSRGWENVLSRLRAAKNLAFFQPAKTTKKKYRSN